MQKGIQFRGWADMREATIKKQIQEQEKHDKAKEKQRVREKEEPFKDSK